MAKSRLLILTLLISVLFITPALARPAEAQAIGGLSVGGWFSVGNVDFSLVFGAPVYGRAPDYYYRAPAWFAPAACADSFREGGYVYFDPGCPEVRAYFARYHQRPELLFEGYAPPPVWRGRYYGDRDDGYRYGRRYGYDRIWSRSDRKQYYERHAVARPEPYRDRGDRYRGRGYRGRGHDGRDHDGH